MCSLFKKQHLVIGFSNKQWSSVKGLMLLPPLGGAIEPQNIFIFSASAKMTEMMTENGYQLPKHSFHYFHIWWCITA